MNSLFLLTALLVTTLGALQARAPQEVPPQPPDETVTIRGRVTDRDSGQPLPRARVSAYSGALDLRKAPAATTTTDDSGFYELAALPAGNYLLLAQPPPHVSSHLAQVYGADAPYDPAAPALFGPQASLRLPAFKGIDPRNVNISLTRALAIEGRVTSDDADPVAGMPVALHRTDIPLRDPLVRLTDDRGIFRHFGLVPGRYRVCASAPGGAASASPRSIRRTCYPADGQSLDLRSEPIGGFDIRLLRGKALTITGIALDSAGAPLDRGQIQFIEDGDATRTSLPVERTAGGRFVIHNVEPGAYRLFAGLLTDSPQEPELRERLTLAVPVDRDIENLVVRTRPPTTVAGTVSFEDVPPSKSLERLLIGGRVDGVAFPLMTPRTGMSLAAVQNDLSFRITGMFESSRIVLVGLPSGWVVKSITYRGRDITHVAVDFEGPLDPHPITVVVTNRVAHIGGRVVASDKRPQTVMLIAADRARWTTRDAIVATAPVKPDGTFQIASVAAGEYLIVASNSLAPLEVIRAPAAALERLAAHAERIALAEGDRREVTLSAAGER